jgi:hypothetical protein
MFEQYLAALLGLSKLQDLAHSALPDAPVRPQPQAHQTDPDHHRQEPPPPTDTLQAAPAHPPIAGGPNRFWQSAPCPCRRPGITRGDHHGCLALVTELFPQLDQDLDTWDANHGWLYH